MLILNCAPFVMRYTILSNKWGSLLQDAPNYSLNKNDNDCLLLKEQQLQKAIK